MRNKKGFTLIELLAVIVILGIIALIAVPLILGIIDNVKISAYKQSLTSLFDATDLYLATNDFIDMPEEGISITDSTLQINHSDFTSGKIIKNEQDQIELERVSNGAYCGGGTFNNIVIIEGSCDQLDTTSPNISIIQNLVTSSSITIVATGEDLESGISAYQFSKDNGLTWTAIQTSNIYTFTGLTNNTNYIFKTRVYNNNNLMTVSDELLVQTSDIPLPTYSIDTTLWSLSKVITIHYPTRETGYVYEYSVDGALTWQEVVSPAITKGVVFNENGTIIARILDGSNEISGTVYTVTNIDIVNPSATIIVSGNPFNGNGWANANFNLDIATSDTGSGISYFKYCSTTSATCVPTTIVNNISGSVIINTESTTNKACVQSFDNVGNSSSVVCSSNYKLDKTPPVAGNINVSGTLGTNGWYTANVTISKTDGSDTLSGHASSVLSHTSIISETSGTTVALTTTDNAGNTSIKNQIIKIDKTNPGITFSMNGNSTYVKSRATLVSVTDALSGVLGSSLKYLWNTSTTTPSQASFTSSFTNNQSISTPAGVTGGYYLWILSLDNAGNTTITRSNVFNLDNTIPVLTLNGSSSVELLAGSTYTDAGATASDNINGNITSSIVMSGSVNINVPGTYILTYNVSDASGNAATSVTRTVTITTNINLIISGITSPTGFAVDSNAIYAVDAGNVEAYDFNGNLKWSTPLNISPLTTSATNEGGIMTLRSGNLAIGITYYDGTYRHLAILQLDKNGNYINLSNLTSMSSSFGQKLRLYTECDNNTIAYYRLKNGSSYMNYFGHFNVVTATNDSIMYYDDSGTIDYPHYTYYLGGYVYFWWDSNAGTNYLATYTISTGGLSTNHDPTTFDAPNTYYYNSPSIGRRFINEHLDFYEYANGKTYYLYRNVSTTLYEVKVELAT